MFILNVLPFERRVRSPPSLAASFSCSFEMPVNAKKSVPVSESYRKTSPIFGLTAEILPLLSTKQTGNGILPESTSSRFVLVIFPYLKKHMEPVRKTGPFMIVISLQNTAAVLPLWLSSPLW